MPKPVKWNAWHNDGRQIVVDAVYSADAIDTALDKFNESDINQVAVEEVKDTGRH
jgi:hypothetical protein